MTSAELVADLGWMLLGWTVRRHQHRRGPRHQGAKRVPARSVTAQQRPGRVRALRQCEWVWSLLPHGRKEYASAPPRAGEWLAPPRKGAPPRRSNAGVRAGRR